MKNIELEKNEDLTVTITRVSWWILSVPLTRNFELDCQYNSFFREDFLQADNLQCITENF